MMREAMFETIFCGIETTDADALKAMAKEHNNMVPILQAISTLNGYGMEVVSGIILGLDTDTSDSGKRLLEFVESSQIPLLTMNLLQALPRTPLWDRLKREQRLLEDDDNRESNVLFRLPYEQVLDGWRACMRTAYQPEALYRRYEHQIRATYPNRLHPKDSVLRAPTWPNIRRGLIIASRLFWFVGVRGSYRRVFWQFAWRRLRRGDMQNLIMVSLVAHHLILFAREASSGRRDASHYTYRPRDELVAAK
jgi:radical SAM superfamily enzyme YgiQ (UPF0313 family)